MTRIYVSLLMVLIAYVSCNQKQGLEKLNYDKETLRKVMQDLYISSEAIKKIDLNVQDSMASIYKSDIERIHGIDMTLYEKDLKFLIQHPELYTEIHKEVRDSLIQLEAQVNAMKYD